MDPDRERIQADLKGLLEGGIRCDELFTQMYADDASIFEIRPLGVVRPRSTEDVVTCVRYAHENQIPIHARGAGTGLAGESIGPGLVLDFSYGMRRIVSIDQETEPGVVHSTLNRRLQRQGRVFGPDPATSQVTTMGSVLAINAAGSHWLEYGSASQHVESMKVVLADGETLEIGREKTGEFTSPDVPSRRNEIVRQLHALLDGNRDLIDAHQPKSLVNRCGYQLANLIENDQLDLARLLVGSEGTLALITEATIKTVPLPTHRGVCLLFFDRMENAARAAIDMPERGAVACDLIDRRLLTIARENDVRFDVLVPPEAEAMVLVEFFDADSRLLRKQLEEIVSDIHYSQRLAFASCIATDPEDVAFHRQLVEGVVPLLYRLRGTTRPLPFVEDMAVPPAELPDFLMQVQNIFKKHRVTTSLLAHAGHGQLHLRPFLDLGNPGDVAKMRDLADELYEAVLAIGGTISGEHADGLSRTAFVRRQYGPVYDLFREVKRIFDPRNIFNPGKVVGDDLELHAKNLRPVSVAPPSNRDDRTDDDSGDSALARPTEPSAIDSVPEVNEFVELQLDWNTTQIAHMARSCNGCGHCRTREPDERMCPIFRLTAAEEASPRSKANLLRAVFTGRLEPEELSGEAMRAVADLCIHCHQCHLECPANVDIPKLMVEVKAQYVATHGPRSDDRFTFQLERAARLGSRIHRLSNWMITSRTMRWLMERMLGIAQGRKLPCVTSRSFLQQAYRRRLTRPSRRSGDKVVLFVDLYANWFDTQLASALVAVLEHNGISVFVPPQQVSSGAELLTCGGVERARDQARKNIPILAEAVRQGYKILTTEPTSALCLQQSYPYLFDEPDSQIVAANTLEACTYLWQYHQQGKLELDLKPLNYVVGYHTPCHLKALKVGTPGENLLRLIPGMVVERLDKGCSAMAGMYGIKKKTYRTSLRAGWPLISAVRDANIQAGTTECSSCKIQMEQGTTKPTIHPLKILAHSYGLMPELEHLFSSRSGELTIS